MGIFFLKLVIHLLMIVFILHPLNEVVGVAKDCQSESLTSHYIDLTKIIKGRYKWNCF